MKKTVKVESKDCAKILALIQQFNELENIWKSQENSRRRHSTASASASASASDHSIITSFDHTILYQQTSPRTLMSSLQHRNRKPAPFRLNSDAVEEILIDRRDAITSGRFKGRQLFLEAEEEEEEEEDESALTHTHTHNGGSEISSDWIQEREVIMYYQGSGSAGDDQYQYDQSSSDLSESCSLPEEKFMVVEEKKAVEVAEAAEKRGRMVVEEKKAVEVAEAAEKRGSDRRVATAVVLIVLALLVLFFISCNGNNVEDFFLVPT